MTDPLVAWLRATIEERMHTAKKVCIYQKRLRRDDKKASGGWEFWGEFGDLVYPLIDMRTEITRCEADLAILEDHSDHGGGECERCSERLTLANGHDCSQPEPYPCRTVRLVAWGHRRRDGYAEVAGDWAPDDERADGNRHGGT